MLLFDFACEQKKKKMHEDLNLDALQENLKKIA